MNARTLVMCALLAGPVGCAAKNPQPAPAAAPAPIATGATHVRTFEGIEEYVLPNGLRVLLFPDETQSTFTVAMTVLVGSRHEGYGETGMAHLLEHMAFKGTPTHRNILSLIDARGGSANGTTWTDRTNYFETLPATGDNLAWALAMEADRLVNCTISEDDLSTEFSVVRNEFEMGENHPASILEERVTSTAYLWHNYGNTTIGARSDIEGVPVENLRSFYRRWYRPDNTMLVVAGKIDPAETLALVERTFGPLAPGADPLPTTYTVEPVQDGEREVVLRRTGDVHHLLLAYHTVSGADPSHPAVEALTEILDRRPTGRLYAAMVETGLASEVWSYTYAFKDPTLLLVSATVPDASKVEEAERVLVSTVEGLATVDITPEEVERFRNRALKYHDLMFADSEYTAVELSEWAALGDWRLLFARRHAIEALTDADVEQVARTWLLPSNRTIGRFVPTPEPVRAPLPEAPDVAAIVAALEDSGGPAKGEAFTATLDNLEERSVRKELAGGIEAVLLPKKTRGEQVDVMLRLRAGDATSLASTQAIAPLTASLMARGTAKRDFQAVADEMDRLRASIGLSGGPGEITATVTTDRAHLAEAIDLAMEMIREPSFPASELEVVRREAIARLEEARQDPSQVASVTLEQTLQPWPAEDPRATLTVDQLLPLYEAATIGDLQAYHRAFVGTGDGELVALGDFDADALVAQLDAHLEALPAAKPWVRAENKVFGAPGAEHVVDLRDKEMAQILLAHQLPIRDDHPDYPALMLAVRILGGGTGSRLWMRLREREGLSYGTWGWMWADARDEVGGFGASAIVAPHNLDRAKQALLEEVRKVATEGVSAEELEEARVAWVQSADTRLANDDRLLWGLADQAHLGRTFARDRELRAQVATVTLEEVTRAAATYLRPDDLVIVVAGDMTKAHADRP